LTFRTHEDGLRTRLVSVRLCKHVAEDGALKGCRLTASIGARSLRAEATWNRELAAMFWKDRGWVRATRWAGIGRAVRHQI